MWARRVGPNGGCAKFLAFSFSRHSFFVFFSLLVFRGILVVFEARRSPEKRIKIVAGGGKEKERNFWVVRRGPVEGCPAEMGCRVRGFWFSSGFRGRKQKQHRNKMKRGMSKNKKKVKKNKNKAKEKKRKEETEQTPSVRLRPINFDFGQFRLRPIRFRPAGRNRIVRSRIGRGRASSKSS